MSSKLVAFRCHADLLSKLDELANAANSNRSAVLVEAIRIFTRQVQRRGGQVVPAYSKTTMHKDVNLPPVRSFLSQAMDKDS